ncbi:alpha/beta hydrolase [uncultured Streptomyces sp.]|uniref:alpha/beta hydrolase family protein n=1 Tax=uncultured Streptomyces sp. TaxID=174707 RepID=UPI0034484EE1
MPTDGVAPSIGSVPAGGSTVPLTGILCTANGSTIELVENLLAMGEPLFQSFTDPRVTFFELPTGHWPMLSMPEELATVLLRAAAGEGHRIEARRPPHLNPFLFEVSERERERSGAVDFYLPDASEPRPAVVFVHGGPVPPNARPTPRDWPVFTGYGRHVAALGAVGVTVDHRLHALTDYPRAAQDLVDAVEHVRSHPQVDGDRIALWFFSGGGLLSAPWLVEPPTWLRCVAGSYPVLAPFPNWDGIDPGFRPVEAVRGAGRLPIVLIRPELDYPESLAAIDEFLASASAAGVHPEVIDVPGARHAFETIDHTDPAREAVRRGVGKVLGHVEAGHEVG